MVSKVINKLVDWYSKLFLPYPVIIGLEIPVIIRVRKHFLTQQKSGPNSKLISNNAVTTAFFIYLGDHPLEWENVIIEISDSILLPLVFRENRLY